MKHKDRAITAGDTVRHPFDDYSYGLGKVIRLYPFQGTVFVRWEKKGEQYHLPHWLLWEKSND